jgi:exodeoxyribonuclease V beta subunit
MDGADWLAIWRTQQATAQTGAVDAATATVARLGAVATLRVLPPGDDDDDADADDAPVAATPPDAAVPASSLPSRSLPRPPRARGQHSYSSLVQQAEATPSADEAIAAGAVDEALTVADAASGEPSGEPSGDASSDATPTGIFAFARGPGPGACLHTILEQVQLGRLDATDRATVERLLAEAGLWHAGPQPSTAHRAAIDPVAVVMDMLHSLLAATLPRQGTPLRPLLLAEASIEWQFTLPLASGASGSLASTTADLARRFATSDSTIARDYSSRLQRLPDRALRGFLVGFIDRVVACDGRYWVLDWKSNHLGNHAADYHDANLWQAMHEHDYVLQYHLYVLALHRQLRARLPGYTPERHLGGVLYPFLRGLVAGSSHGIAQDEVPASLVASLDAWAMGERL